MFMGIGFAAKKLFFACMAGPIYTVHQKYIYSLYEENINENHHQENINDDHHQNKESRITSQNYNKITNRKHYRRGRKCKNKSKRNQKKKRRRF